MTGRTEGGATGAALAIINPVAGKGAASRSWDRVEVELRGHYADLMVRITERRGDAEGFAREWGTSCGEFPVFACGGDGTVHEVVNGLLEGRDRAVLGIVPLGTGNDFAGTTSAALARLGGPARRFDAGRIRFADGSTRVFLNSASVGVVPHANQLAGRLKKVIPGKAPYSLGGAGALLGASSGDYVVRSGGKTLHEGAALNVTLANGARFGGGLRISPGSRADDGSLDVVIIGNIGKLKALVALSRLGKGGHIGMPGIVTEPVAGPVEIARRDGEMLVECDGEEYRAGREISVEALPGAIELVN